MTEGTYKQEIVEKIEFYVIEFLKIHYVSVRCQNLQEDLKIAFERFHEDKS